MSQNISAHWFVRRFAGYMTAPILQTVVALGTIPLKAHFLGPADFGDYALVTSYVIFCVTISPLGTNYLMSFRFQTVTGESRSKMVSTFLWMSIFNSTVLGTILVAAFLFFRQHLESLATLSTSSFLITAASMPFSIVWIIASDVSTLEGNSRPFAYCSIAQAIVSTVVLIFCLLVFDFTSLSLYLSNLAGAIAAGCVGWRALAGYRRWTINFSDVREAFRSGPAMILSNGSESIQRIFENNVIASHLGTIQLGIYAHSQQYRNMTSMPLKAVIRTIWPVSLQEAHNSIGMEKTRRYWICSSLAIMLFSLGFFAVGKPFVNWLTHYRFTGVDILISIWLSALILQNTGRSQTALLFANGYGSYSAWSMLFSIVMGMAILIPAVMYAQIYGVFFSFVVQQLIYIWLLSAKSKSINKEFSSEKFHTVCAVVIVLLEFLANWLNLNTLSRFLIGCLTSLIVLVYFAYSERKLFIEIKAAALRFHFSRKFFRGAHSSSEL